MEKRGIGQLIKMINTPFLQFYPSRELLRRKITAINPNVELYSARVLDEDKSAPVSRVVEAIYWAIEKKVNIISLSFGMTVPSAALETAVKEAYDKGILIVAAAGNHGVVEYPAAMEEVMAVGGTDTDGTVCDYSAEGGTGGDRCTCREGKSYGGL